ncbi:hypothetical protein LZF95_21430 [Algoriphagus sp. AGSA1]|uniref:hypothetical protein n=1 Tax=Algoriphagus sp. AGSA1 TaxID=2907213 RepID=UPI001F479DC6|nr:hypothetical protein [Algoriphagus sp. AGSA1]MCE7057257.1 hypothetical protein [Algoriphagus sp. AGSA1]
MLHPNPVPTQFLTHSFLEEKGIELVIKRLDLVHPEVSGNKFLKLKCNLEKAKLEEKTKIQTFGGAFSNHLYANSQAAKAENLEAFGTIRGEKQTPSTPHFHMQNDWGCSFIILIVIAIEKKPPQNTA